VSQGGDVHQAQGAPHELRGPVQRPDLARGASARCPSTRARTPRGELRASGTLGGAPAREPGAPPEPRTALRGVKNFARDVRPEGQAAAGQICSDPSMVWSTCHFHAWSRVCLDLTQSCSCAPRG